MPVQIDITAGESFAFAKTEDITDGDTVTSIRFVFRWLPRLERWVCTPTTPGGVQLGIQQQVAASGRLLLDVRDPLVPPGRFVWVGEDPYIRTSLGDTVRLVYLTAAEVAALNG